MKMINRIIYLIIPLLAFALSCEEKNLYDVKFSYQGIIDKEYRFNVGRVIPVTIGQAIETDGDISRDGKYFFYTSNSDGGNYDIYLRSMTDITTVRLTSHPSKDITPVISPDGKRLAFVSYRDDPEGDIFVMKIKAGELIQKEEKSISGQSPLDNVVKNITIEKEKDTDVIINIKDSNPAWSPDGSLIAYSSSKGGTANIWLMKSDGSDKKKITEKGGQYPAFSPDGNKVVFISYRENANGDLYTIDIKSGSESRITSDRNIKLYPSFMNDADRIIYSSIENDTDSSGSLDLQDRSVIRFIDIRKNLSYPLTKKSESSFKAKWLPVLTTRDYNGIIIYTDITGENINLNIIPETGIIPKKLNAKLQYEMCETFLEEYDDTEKYLLSLESVYNYYSGNVDNSSKAYVNRALEEAALYYRKSGESAEAKRIISTIKKRSEAKDLYASFILDMIEKPGEWKSEADILSIAKKFGTEKSSIYFIPFAMEDAADAHLRRKDKNSALKVLTHIASDYKDFERILDIHTKISLCSDHLGKTGLSDSAVKVFEKGNTNQKIAVIKNLADPFSVSGISSSEADAVLVKINSLKIKFKEDKKITAVLSYASGLLYDSKGLPDKSREELLQSITLSHPNDLTFYLSNIKLGEIERRQSRFAEAEKYFSAGINRYSRRFKTENFKEKLLWLIGYYEQAGGKNELAGNFKNASETYEKLINLVTLMHNKRLYPEVYSEYAPKAHIFYIDSYTGWKGEASIADLEAAYTEKLPVYRMDFNRAAIYGLGYIYTKKALHLTASENLIEKSFSISDVYETFKKADEQLDWALFIDDGFIEAYILKSWIYQYVDYDRNTSGEDVEKYAGKYLPKHLWEDNIVLLEKALNANDENKKPENEGNLHLNMANNYFLLLNYPRALKSYRLAEKYKKTFGSDIEKALFHFHLGYSLWQNDEIKEANTEIRKAYEIYNSLSLSGGSEKYKYQYLTIYRYFALFSRYENKYTEAITWYRKILRFAESSKLEIDRARYNQEIAYCYIKTGELESAKIYLERAENMLEKYPDDERKYYLKMKLFGIGPFPVFNLGSDSVVIGDNRIFHPLDTQNKKLLNISMLEEIAVLENDYPRAIKILKEKVDVLEDSSTSVAVDARIRSLNNLGYYYYISGKLKEAEKYFNKGGDLAAEKSNLQGTFSSMMNLVTLYALMIEDEKNYDKEWNKKVSDLISRIESYRNSYYDMRLTQEKEALDLAADAKNEKVSEQQISELKALIGQETVAIYYSLDISAAILKYYLAEILYASDPVLSVSQKDVSVLYSVNRDIYNLYKSALNRFEPAIEEAEKSGRRELKAKLILNAASCYERTGDFEKAYVSLLDAKNFSEQNALSWVKINAYHKLGNFLYEHGKEVEKTDSSALADKYFSQAAAAVEEYPSLYSSYSNRIRIIYGDYINFLIDRGSEKRAFETAERYAQAARIISINLLSPKFSNEYDRKKYYDYSGELGKLNSLRSELSALLLTAKNPLSPEIVSMKKKISSKEEELNVLRKDIRSNYSSIRPYVEMPGYRDLSLNTDIFRFHETEQGIYYWKVSAGKMSSGYVKNSAGSILPVNSASPAFILLSDTAVEMINSGSLKSSENYIFVNTLDRIPEYLKDANSLAGSIYSEEKGIRSDAEGINAAEGKVRSFSDYSLIVDRISSENDVTPELLFSSSLSPVCIIQTGIKSDYNYLTTLMEGAFYADAKRIVVTSGTGSDAVLPLVRKMYGRSETPVSSPFFTLGYINTFIDKSISENKQLQDKEFALFSGYMKNADFSKAGVHLSRWNSLQKEKNSMVYVSNLWLMELLQGRTSESLAVLDLYTPADDNERSEIKLRRAYTYLYSGDIKRAGKEMSGIPAAGAVQGDLTFLNALFSIMRDGNFSSIDRISGMKKPYSTILPVERYLIPAAEFLYLNRDERATKLAAMIPDTSYLSEGEHLMLQIIGEVKPPSGRSIRFDRIAALWNIKDLSEQRDEAAKLIRGENGMDYLSVYPVLEIVLRHEGKNLDEELIQFGRSVNIERVLSRSEYLPSVMLLKRIDDLYSDNEKYQERISILKEISNISAKSSLNSIRKENILDTGMNYYLMQNYDGSYKAALSAEELFTPEDRSYVDMQLLRMNLYIKAGRYKEAEVKGELLRKAENISADRKYILNLQLSLIELNRLSSLKKASIADAAQFEKLFSSALSLVKHDTEILNRRGYREITGQIFDEYINYKMKTGQHTDAHYYNEVRKLILASSKCGSNLFKYAGTIDMDVVQQILPDKGLYVNIAKNKDDLFIWTADKKNKRAFVIEKGNESLMKFMNDYLAVSASGKDLTASSKEIAKILSPLYQMMKDKKVILISTDSDSEKIPFEIAGDGDMISNKSLLIYIPSLLVSTSNSGSVLREVYLPETENSAAAYLGRVAIKESGIKYSTVKDSGRGMVHLLSKVRYNHGRREFNSGGQSIKNIKNIGSGSSVLFASSDEIAGAGVSDFLLSGREYNLQAALLNGSMIQDTNNALFIEEFYRNAGKDLSLQESFAAALDKVKGNSRYSYPPNWSGYRLYIYDLNLLKAK
jgi:tetratricopeptide (TPR) repeat protein